MTETITNKEEGELTLSVVIPVYNGEKYLEKCLDSVLASTFSGFEVICVDDGSSDRSLQILHDYAEKDPRFRILTQNHLYAGAARNTGILAARGKYIHFLDADDEIVPEAYERWIAAAEAERAEVCEALHLNIDGETGRVISEGKFRPYDEDVPLSIDSSDKNAASLVRGNVVPWNKLYLRSFLTGEKIFFDDLICAEDRSFYFEVIFKVRRIIRLKEHFVLHRVRIDTSLDGSDIRFRRFDVEFRSFERIWDIAKDAPDNVRRHVLDSCIGDSFAYYQRAFGTEYENPIREMLREYWKPYLPLLGDDILHSWWYLLYKINLMSDGRERYGRFLFSLYNAAKNLGKYKNLPAKCVRYFLKLILRLLTYKSRSQPSTNGRSSS